MKTISKNTNPIGFFDSGVGGLSVLARFRKILPSENIVYFGDTVHLPYGNKSKEELIGYTNNILNFMESKSVKAVVIACNTSSAQAYDTIKGNYPFPIYPIIQSCAGGVAELGVGRVGVFATEATVKSGKYTEELKKCNQDIQVKEIASKNWVGIVEGVGDNIEEKRMNIRYEIEEMLEFNPDKIILGCTHYPYLMDEFIKYAPKELFIDPAEIFAEYIKNDLSKQNLLNVCQALPDNNCAGTEEFYVSSNPKEFVKNAKIFYEIKKLPILV